MSDRYSDRYDSYDDGYDGYDSYSDSRYGRSHSDRSSYRSSDSYSDDYYDSYSDSRYRASQRRSGTSSGSSSSRRSTRSSASRYDATESLFGDYYPESSDVDFYRRSSYGSGSSRGTSSRQSSRQSAYSDSYADARSTRSTRRVSHTSPTPRQSTRSSSRYQDAYDDYDTPRQSARGASASRRSVSQGSHSRRSADGYAQRSSADYYGQQSSHGGSHGGYSARNSYDDGDYAPKRSNRKRNLIIAGVVALAIVLIGAGAAFAYVNSISNNLHEGLDEETINALNATPTETALGDEAFYMLLMGIDTSANRVEYEEDGDTTRSDSMILARVDPVNKKVALISIHRDTIVDMGEYGEQKINAAYQYWGAAGAIDAVSKMAGVPITHYASVDFDGFRAIVDSLGGVEVDVPIEINDPDADPDYGDGHLDAGLQTLDGRQALILCRSRHTYDDIASDGDVMRAANQRMVIGAIAKKILASDIMTIATTVQTMSQYITTDLELTDIIGLAQLFQGVDPDADIYTAMEPTTSAYIDDVWYEYLDQDAWDEMIKRMDQGLAPVNKTEIDDATGVILSTGGADAPVV